MSNARDPSTRAREPLIAYLNHVDLMNQREFVALNRAIQFKTVIGKQAYEEMHMEMMKFVVRTKSQKTFEDELHAVAHHINASLTTAWDRASKQNVSPITWLGAHRALVALIVDDNDIGAVLSANGSWHDVVSQVVRLAACGDLGSSLFGGPKKLVASAVYAMSLKTIISSINSAPALTAEVMKKLKDECREQAALLSDGAALRAKRDFKVEFLGKAITLSTMDPGMEWENRIAAAVKTRSLSAKDGLTRFHFEDMVMQARSSDIFEVDPAILEPFENVRKLAKEMLAAAKVVSVADSYRILEKAASTLLMVDRSFNLELKYLEVAGTDAVTDAFHKQILAALPAADRNFSFTQSVDLLSQLEKSETSSVVPASERSKLVCVKDLIFDMDKNGSPDCELADRDKLYRQVFAQLPYFHEQVVIKEQVGDVSSERALTGKEAIDHRFDEIKAGMADPKASVSLVDIKKIECFAFVFAAEQKQLHSQWIQVKLTEIGKSSAKVRKKAVTKDLPSNKSSSSSSAPKNGGGNVSSFFD
jgi:hypothetical protein